MKTTSYFRDVVRRKHPGIKEAWIQRVLADPLEERRQPDGRFALWGLVPEAQNRALRVMSLEDRETVHNAFFDCGFLRAVIRSQAPSAPRSSPDAMKIRYFPEPDTLYIALADRDSSSSQAINDNLIVDFDAQGRSVGVTLEHDSEISDSSAIETLLPIPSALQPA